MAKNSRRLKRFSCSANLSARTIPINRASCSRRFRARFFRISVEKEKFSTKPILMAETGLSGRLTVDDLPGKTFCQRHFFQAKPEKKSAATAKDAGAVAMGDVVDLSSQMDRTGRLTWAVPAGNWTIVRIGHQSNGTRNHPAPEGGEGLECDKLSTAAVDAHWAGMVGKMIGELGPHAGKAFTKVEVDSWEVGTQNWTPKFREEFARRRGYDLTHFLPVFAGQTVDSIEVTERFLWDFRRTIADLLAENYAGRLRNWRTRTGWKWWWKITARAHSTICNTAA